MLQQQLEIKTSAVIKVTLDSYGREKYNKIIYKTVKKKHFNLNSNLWFKASTCLTKKYVIL